MPITNQQIMDKLTTIELHIVELSTEMKQMPEMKADIHQLRDCVTNLKVNVGKLEVKSGIIGAIAGGIIIAVNYIVQTIRQ